MRSRNARALSTVSRKLIVASSAAVSTRFYSLKPRLVTLTDTRGAANVVHYDRGGKVRITAVTNPDGTASVVHSDSDQRVRVLATTKPDGEAGIQHWDRDEKARIVTRTFPGGIARVIEKETPKI